MLRNASKGLRLRLSVRSFSSTKQPSALSTIKPTYKVAVIGAAGGIGQPLSLLLKKNPYVKHLNLYDVAPVTPGVAVDLSHIPSPAEVHGFTGKDMSKALEGADIVIVPAGVPRKPGMTRDDLFSINAGIVANVAKGIAENCPKAQMLIISNPVNSTVPVAAEILKRMKAFDPKRVFGVTTLDELRALTFVRKALEAKNKILRQKVTVIGGHAGITILPLLSQIEDSGLTESEIAALTQRIMFGGDEVVKAKEGGGSATLSMAAAGHEFASAVMFGLAGQSTTKAAYVYSDVCTDKEVNFFASLVKLGPEGVEQILAPGKMSSFEQQKYKELIPELKDSIKKGVAFGQAYKL